MKLSVCAADNQAHMVQANNMEDKPASQQIDDIIETYGGWKGELLSQLRALIKQADPAVIEEVKWKTPSRP